MKIFILNNRRYETKEIVGSKYYYISKCGYIISWKRSEAMVLRGGINHGGYIAATILFKNGSRKNMFPHRLVMHYFCGPRPTGMVINHKDCNPKNNHIDNLEYCTPKENIHHAMKNGRMQHGEKINTAKLTKEEVLEIRRLDRDVPRILLGYVFGVSRQTIRHVAKRKTWARV